MTNIIIGGDLVFAQPLEQLSSTQYDTHFGAIKDLIVNADYSILNLESPIVSSRPTPIAKLGPNLYCSPKVCDFLNYLGIDCVTLANNHFYDQGETGIATTINCCKENNIAYVGGGQTLSEASKTLFIEIEDKTIAIINCCEREYSIASAETGGANPLSPIDQYYAISEARMKADFVIVITHGGIEHFQYPTSEMQKTFRFFIDAGANVVINHHQHCYSGYEIYRSSPIFYGIGNFCFPRDQYKNSFWNEGYLVSLRLDKTLEFKILPYIQCNATLGIEPLDNEKRADFDTSLADLNYFINNDSRLAKVTKEFMNATESKFEWLFQPVSNRIYHRLANHNLLPKLVSTKKIDEFLSLIKCDSHRMRLISYLNNHTTKHFV